MAERREVIAAARGWLGVRWRHQGRSRAGVDCVGLLIVVARQLDLMPPADLDAIEGGLAGYSRYPRGGLLNFYCRRHLAPVDEPQPGDVLLFAIDGQPQHLGLVGEHPAGAQSLIHAYALGPRRVVETVLDQPWRRRIVGAFALPGVA